MLHPPELASAIPPHATTSAPPLLVVVRDAADVDGPLAEAAGRARAAGRPLVVAILLPPRPLTIDAAIHGLHARLVADLVAALTATVRRRCGRGVRVVHVRQPRGRSRRACARLARRLAALADRHGAELHPPAAVPGHLVGDVR